MADEPTDNSVTSLTPLPGNSGEVEDVAEDNSADSGDVGNSSAAKPQTRVRRTRSNATTAAGTEGAAGGARSARRGTVRSATNTPTAKAGRGANRRAAMQEERARLQEEVKAMETKLAPDSESDDANEDADEQVSEETPPSGKPKARATRARSAAKPTSTPAATSRRSSRKRTPGAPPDETPPPKRTRGRSASSTPSSAQPSPSSTVQPVLGDNAPAENEDEDAECPLPPVGEPTTQCADAEGETDTVEQPMDDEIASQSHTAESVVDDQLLLVEADEPDETDLSVGSDRQTTLLVPNVAEDSLQPADSPLLFEDPASSEPCSAAAETEDADMEAGEESVGNDMLHEDANPVEESEPEASCPLPADDEVATNAATEVDSAEDAKRSDDSPDGGTVDGEDASPAGSSEGEGQFEVLEEVSGGADDASTAGTIKPLSGTSRSSRSMYDEDGNALEQLDYDGDEDEIQVQVNAVDDGSFVGEENKEADEEKDKDAKTAKEDGNSTGKGVVSGGKKPRQEITAPSKAVALAAKSGATITIRSDANGQQPNKRLFRKARYFIIKSNNHDNVEIAKARNVWATLQFNEKKLNKAFRECSNVILIFSVRESGKFQGFARLASDAVRDGTVIPWVLPHSIQPSQLDGLFRLQWIHKGRLDFQRTIHLKNPWNENKVVKIGRDGQEVEPTVGEKLCRLFFSEGEGGAAESQSRTVVMGGNSGGGAVLSGGSSGGGAQPVIQHKAFQPIIISSNKSSGGGNSSSHASSSASSSSRSMASSSGGAGNGGNTDRAPRSLMASSGGVSTSTTSSKSGDRHGSPIGGSLRQSSPHSPGKNRQRVSPRPDSRTRSPRADVEAALARSRGNRSPDRRAWERERGPAAQSRRPDGRDRDQDRERARYQERERDREFEQRPREEEFGRRRDEEYRGRRDDYARRPEPRDHRGGRYEEDRHRPPPSHHRHRSRSRSYSPPPGPRTSHRSNSGSRHHGVHKSTILHGSYDDYVREYQRMHQTSSAAATTAYMQAHAPLYGSSAVPSMSSSSTRAAPKAAYEAACNDFLQRTRAGLPTALAGSLPGPSSSHHSGGGSSRHSSSRR